MLLRASACVLCSLERRFGTEIRVQNTNHDFEVVGADTKRRIDPSLESRTHLAHKKFLHQLGPSDVPEVSKLASLPRGCSSDGL